MKASRNDGFIFHYRHIYILYLVNPTNNFGFVSKAHIYRYSKVKVLGYCATNK